MIVRCEYAVCLDTQQTHNVVSTSLQRHDVAATLIRRCWDVVCLLGYNYLLTRMVCCKPCYHDLFKTLTQLVYIHAGNLMVIILCRERKEGNEYFERNKNSVNFIDKQPWI